MKSKLSWFTALSVTAIIALSIAGVTELVAQPNDSDTGGGDDKKEAKADSEKKIEITEEDGVRTMKVTLTENGVTTIEEYTGDEIDEYLKEEENTFIFDRHVKGEDLKDCEIRVKCDLGGADKSMIDLHFNFDEDFMAKVMELKDAAENEELTEEEMKAKVQEIIGDFDGLEDMLENSMKNLEGSEDGNVFEWSDGNGSFINSKVIVLSDEDEEDLEKMLEENGIDVNVDILTTDATGKSVSQTLIIKKSVTIEEMDTDEAADTPKLEVNDLNFYPNPNDGQFQLSFETPQAGDVAVTITDLQGKEVYAQNVEGGKQKMNIDISNESNGVYLLNLRQGDLSTSKRIVIGK